MSENQLQVIDVFSKVLGLTNPCFMRFSKRTRNPDVFTYDSSIDYKEDFDLVEDSFCGCGCKSAVYVQEHGYGEDGYTELKTQIEYEQLPNQPKPTKEEIQLQTDIIRTNRKEEELGIIHKYQTCGEIPIPKLIVNEDILKRQKIKNEKENIIG